MKHAYLNPLQKAYEAAANEELAAKMAAYLKDHFSMYGIKTEPRRDIIKAFFKENGLPAAEEMPAEVQQALDSDLPVVDNEQPVLMGADDDLPVAPE